MLASPKKEMISSDLTLKHSFKIPLCVKQYWYRIQHYVSYQEIQKKKKRVYVSKIVDIKITWKVSD